MPSMTVESITGSSASKGPSQAPYSNGNQYSKNTGNVVTQQCPSNDSKGNPLCYKCGKIGYASECPNHPNQAKIFALGVNNGAPEPIPAFDNQDEVGEPSGVSPDGPIGEARLGDCALDASQGQSRGESEGNNDNDNGVGDDEAANSYAGPQPASSRKCARTVTHHASVNHGTECGAIEPQAACLPQTTPVSLPPLTVVPQVNPQFSASLYCPEFPTMLQSVPQANHGSDHTGCLNPPQLHSHQSSRNQTF
ncbi:uncharacterized protein EI90DRAFT_3116808 [Cantharellus anzutake]|uniref:uncharacterized protein n=1 Tax=Cantharellus anzutake TaxID=1750568 RepID=UPI001908787C|nr:uncharacterized protein EI90DRAFT_3116808 [Cantharellus anzutake]KAF8341677.1 hypothetical protein EI90DRAFT_3116808 [Cantharellus anzutake]